MNTKWAVGLLLAAMVSAAVPGKAKENENGVLLKMDYSGKQQWVYSIDYTSQANLKQRDSTSTKSTVVRCLLTGTKKNQGLLSVKADGIVVKSDMLSEDARKGVIDQLAKVTYSLSVANGLPQMDTTTELPSVSYPEWDLYRQLTRLIPSLPAKPVKPGFAWERTATVPMRTVRGVVPCEIYYSYTFTKMLKDTAIVDWQFRYAATADVLDSTNIAGQIPISGNGTGSAVLDTYNRHIISAEMDFATPVAVIGNVAVSWHEHALLLLPVTR
jgi:hypothetical protein